jgi:hypothetical protein
MLPQAPPILAETFFTVRHLEPDGAAPRAERFAAMDHVERSADRMALKMFTSRFRWLTTVGLQGFLGLFFIAFPGTTMRVLQVPPTVHMGVLFQLYGALLLHGP